MKCLSTIWLLSLLSSLSELSMTDEITSSTVSSFGRFLLLSLAGLVLGAGAVAGLDSSLVLPLGWMSSLRSVEKLPSFSSESESESESEVCGGGREGGSVREDPRLFLLLSLHTN